MAIIDKTHSLTIEEAFNSVAEGGGGSASFLTDFKTIPEFEFDLDLTDNNIINNMNEAGYDIPLEYFTFSLEEIDSVPDTFGLEDIKLYVDDEEVGFKGSGNWSPISKNNGGVLIYADDNGVATIVNVKPLYDRPTPTYGLSIFKWWQTSPNKVVHIRLTQGKALAASSDFTKAFNLLYN